MRRILLLLFILTFSKIFVAFADKFGLVGLTALPDELMTEVVRSLQRQTGRDTVRVWEM